MRSIVRFFPLLLFVCFVQTLQAADKHGEFYGIRPTVYPAWFKDSFLDFKEDVAEARDNNKRIMIVFHQPGCPYCNALVERNLAQKDIETKVRKYFDVIALNMWGDKSVVHTDGKKYTEKTFSSMLKVQFTPTILFMDEAGKIILRLNGYLPPHKFNVALDYVSQRLETKTSYHDYIAQHLPKHKGGKMIHEDFFAQSPYNLKRHSKLKSPPIAVFFEQKDCPNCDTLHKKILIDKKTRNIVKQFESVQLDMWSRTPVITPAGRKTTARDWAKALDVKYAPTIVLFDNQGKEIIRSEAFFKLFHTQGIFAYVLEGGYKTQPSFQRYLSKRAEDVRESGEDVDIWNYADDKK